ncbi:hypothetical protein CRENBAI_010696 [Crenichthys baileyi]|uniref:Uncharacterized protein n=1 Tax=Crenichthys baileyi TaxID=28760 RepID=A0AAV9RUI2_9TELE
MDTRPLSEEYPLRLRRPVGSAAGSGFFPPHTSNFTHRLVRTDLPERCCHRYPIVSLLHALAPVRL